MVSSMTAVQDWNIFCVNSFANLSVCMEISEQEGKDPRDSFFYDMSRNSTFFLFSILKCTHAPCRNISVFTYIGHVIKNGEHQPRWHSRTPHDHRPRLLFSFFPLSFSSNHQPKTQTLRIDTSRENGKVGMRDEKGQIHVITASRKKDTVREKQNNQWRKKKSKDIKINVTVLSKQGELYIYTQVPKKANHGT